MKKLICLIIAVLGILVLFVEIINDFKNSKTFYASINSEKYIYKDVFLGENNYSSQGNNAYIINGKCLSDGLKSTIRIPASQIESNRFTFDSVVIWRVSIAKNSILIRYRNIPDSAFSYNMRDYWFTSLILLLILPSLIYYLYLRNKENKNKTK
ncbi:hypothetical protein NTJ28_002534 [Flavobacterium psychrophilum]|nr:hypothetical protein [Flavobacterium psychrophilum]EKT4510252.1 hypothetical protein [Flavobacterium psychrophilum]